MKNSSRKFETIVSIDRDKMLDEAIFIAICGLRHLRDGNIIVGKTRLIIAREKLNIIVEKLNSDERQK